MFPAALGSLLFYFLYEFCVSSCAELHTSPSALYIGVQSQGKEPGDHREAKVKPPADIMADTKRTKELSPREEPKAGQASFFSSGT